MVKKLAVIIIFLSIFASTIPQSAFGLTAPSDIGTGNQVPTPGNSISCVGIWTKILCVVKKIADVIKSIEKITTILDYLPHQFPFGGPILSSERACQFKFDSWTWIPLFGYPIPIGPIPISRSLGGRAIEVGPPVPTNGKVIAFPWISKIYDQHTENRAGPWALGLGFSPFPLDDINDALDGIVISVPPTFATSCLLFLQVGECLDNFRFDCAASGEKDPFGNDIYKVIRLLGTSDEDAPASAFPPGFTLPLP